MIYCAPSAKGALATVPEVGVVNAMSAEVPLAIVVVDPIAADFPSIVADEIVTVALPVFLMLTTAVPV